MAKEKKKNVGGRPKKYTPEFIEKEADALKKWMSQENSIYLTRFALERGYNNRRLYEFKKVSAKFARILGMAKDWQEVKLVEKGLTGVYNANFTKFVLSNSHGWTEKQQVSGDIENPLAMLLSKLDGESKELVDKDE